MNDRDTPIRHSNFAQQQEVQQHRLASACRRKPGHALHGVSGYGLPRHAITFKLTIRAGIWLLADIIFTGMATTTTMLTTATSTTTTTRTTC